MVHDHQQGITALAEALSMGMSCLKVQLGTTMGSDSPHMVQLAYCG